MRVCVQIKSEIKRDPSLIIKKKKKGVNPVKGASALRLANCKVDQSQNHLILKPKNHWATLGLS